METRRFRAMAATTIALAMLAGVACEGETTPVGSALPKATTGPGIPEIISAKDYDPGNFSDPTTIDNEFFPMKPGIRFTWEGHAIDGGERISRTVVFTITDMTKVIEGVRTLVAWDQDFKNGKRDEIELAFFAQDDDGNVWHFGQYPEEYEGRKIVKTPTWIAGLDGARTGITMQAVHELGTPSYAQGWGPDVHWNDRGKVDAVGESNCVPVDCYSDVLVINEFSKDEPGAHQLKYYAPGVGGIRVGWRGVNEEEQEVLVLVGLEQLSAEEMADLRRQVLEQEERAYELSEVYGRTAPIDPAPVAG